MVKIVVLFGASVGGVLGWWLGSRFGIMTAFILSVIGTGVGVYLSRRFITYFLD